MHTRSRCSSGARWPAASPFLSLSTQHGHAFTCHAQPCNSCLHSLLQVLIWSAVACSSAFPFLYVPQQLLARDSRGQVVPFIAQVGGRLWRQQSVCLSEQCTGVLAGCGSSSQYACRSSEQGWCTTRTSDCRRMRSSAPNCPVAYTVCRCHVAPTPPFHTTLPLSTITLLPRPQTAGEMQRRWRDGSLEEDLPMRGLR